MNEKQTCTLTLTIIIDDHADLEIKSALILQVSTLKQEKQLNMKYTFGKLNCC